MKFQKGVLTSSGVHTESYNNEKADSRRNKSHGTSCHSQSPVHTSLHHSLSFSSSSSLKLSQVKSLYLSLNKSNSDICISELQPWLLWFSTFSVSSWLAIPVRTLTLLHISYLFFFNVSIDGNTISIKSFKFLTYLCPLCWWIWSLSFTLSYFSLSSLALWFKKPLLSLSDLL